MDNAEFVEITAEDLPAAIESTLRKSGYTYEELEALAADDDLPLRARLVWLAVRGLR